MKNCKKCCIDKDESQFFKKNDRWFEGTCKECRRKRVQELVSMDSEKYREKERLRSEKRRKSEDCVKWRKVYQERKRKEISEKCLENYHKKNHLETQKIWKRNNKEKLKQYGTTARKKFPFKAAARAYVCAAIKEGVLVRPEECSSCLKSCKPEAHHEDYVRPLEVIWLCRSCHGRVHRKIKKNQVVNDSSSTSRFDVHFH